MPQNIDQVVRRTYRYFYDDGLAEIAIGLLFMAVGGVLLLWATIDSPSLLGLALAIGLPLVILGGTFLLKSGIRRLKERLTYPRTGYVAYRQKEPAHGRWLVMAVALLLAIAGLIWPSFLGRMQIAVGGLLGTVLFFLGYRVGLWRFYVDGVLALILGFGLALLGLDEVLSTALTFLGAGLALLVGGVLTLISYLNRHPKIDEAL